MKKSTSFIVRNIKFVLLLSLVLSSVKGCRDNGWRDQRGRTCGFYSSNGLCSNGAPSLDPHHAHWIGSEYNYPERNCCACGKDIYSKRVRRV